MTRIISEDKINFELRIAFPFSIEFPARTEAEKSSFEMRNIVRNGQAIWLYFIRQMIKLKFKSAYDKVVVCVSSFIAYVDCLTQ